MTTYIHTYINKPGSARIGKFARPLAGSEPQSLKLCSYAVFIQASPKASVRSSRFSETGVSLHRRFIIQRGHEHTRTGN